MWAFMKHKNQLQTNTGTIIGVEKRPHTRVSDSRNVKNVIWVI